MSTGIFPDPPERKGVGGWIGGFDFERLLENGR